MADLTVKGVGLPGLVGISPCPLYQQCPLCLTAGAARQTTKLALVKRMGSCETVAGYRRCRSNHLRARVGRKRSDKIRPSI